MTRQLVCYIITIVMNKKLEIFIVTQLDRFYGDLVNPKIEILHVDDPSVNYKDSIFEVRIYNCNISFNPSLILKLVINFNPCENSEMIILFDSDCKEKTNIQKLFSLSKEDYLYIFSKWISAKFWYGDIIEKINYLIQQVISPVLYNNIKTPTTRLLIDYPNPFEVTTRTYDTLLWN